MIDLAQIVEGRRHRVRQRGIAAALRAPERASVDCRDRIGREPLRQPLDLHPTIAKWNVWGACERSALSTVAPCLTSITRSRHCCPHSHYPPTNA